MQLGAASSLSSPQQLFVARGTERVREASLIPHFVLSPLSHTSAPCPPQITVPSPFSPTHPSLSLWPFSISPSTHFSLTFSCYLFILHPFTSPLPFPSPFPSRPPRLPFSLFPSPSPAIPVTSPNPFVFPSRGSGSKRIVVVGEVCSAWHGAGLQPVGASATRNSGD